MQEQVLPQEYLIRCEDGVIRGIMVKEQSIITRDDGTVLARGEVVIKDLTETAIKAIAKTLKLKYEPVTRVTPTTPTTPIETVEVE